jgi:hypothetical protein
MTESNPINTREDFEQSMKKWAMLDNKIREFSEQLRELRGQKEETGSVLCHFMKSKGLDKKKIEIGDSVISIYEKNDYSSLTYGFLEKCLGEIIPEKDNVEYIIQYVKGKREVKKSNDLRRVFKNTAKNTSGYETD